MVHSLSGCVFKVLMVVTCFSSCQTLKNPQKESGAGNCSDAAVSRVNFEDWQLLYAKARATAGTVASMSVVAPVGVVEFAAWIPAVIAGQIVTCGPTLALDMQFQTQGSFSQICMAVVPSYITVPELSLTSGLFNATRSWRRTDIKEVIASRRETVGCYLAQKEPDDLQAAYETLEQLILDDRFYKALTPLQLDQVDAELRTLKAALNLRREASKPIKDI